MYLPGNGSICKAVFLGSVQHDRKVSLITEHKMIFSGKKVSPVVQSSE